MKKITVSVFIFWAVFVLCGSALADRILIIRKDESHANIAKTISYLEKLEADGIIEGVDTVTSYQGSYDGYDQIWDLNYTIRLTSGVTDGLKTFLSKGGSLYLVGDRGSGFYEYQSYLRNSTITSFLKNIGAVNSGFSIGGFENASQSVTDEGRKVFPDFSTIQPGGAVYINDEVFINSGFLVSEIGAGSGRGSFVGWDINSLSLYPDSRMVLGLDLDYIGINDNGRLYVENLYSFLSGNTAPVPVPAAVWFFVTGLAGLGIIRNKKDKTSAHQ
jgi:hypothetical protein